MKVQRKKIRTMIAIEKYAGRFLLVYGRATAIISESSSEEDKEKSIMSSIAKKRWKLKNSSVKFIDSLLFEARLQK